MVETRRTAITFNISAITIIHLGQSRDYHLPGRQFPELQLHLLRADRLGHRPAGYEGKVTKVISELKLKVGGWRSPHFSL